MRGRQAPDPQPCAQEPLETIYAGLRGCQQVAHRPPDSSCAVTQSAGTLRLGWDLLQPGNKDFNQNKGEFFTMEAGGDKKWMNHTEKVCFKLAPDAKINSKWITKIKCKT